LSNPVLGPADLSPAETTTRVLASLRESLRSPARLEPGPSALEPKPEVLRPAPAAHGTGPGKNGPALVELSNKGSEHGAIDRLPELIGNAPCMLEVSRRI